MKIQNNARKRNIIDVRTIKKRSSVHREIKEATKLNVSGDRVETSTGFKIDGYAGKNFETLFVYMLEGTSTNVYRHKTKDRVLRAMDGAAMVSLYADNEGVLEVTDTINFVVGDEIHLDRGTIYKISTFGDTPLGMYITQSAKYGSNLEILETSEITKEVPTALLEAPKLADRLMQEFPTQIVRERSNNKAFAQSEAAAARRNVLRQRSQKPKMNTTIEGVNPAPSYGMLDGEDG